MGLFGPELILFLLLLLLCLVFFITAVIVNTKNKYPTTLPSMPSPQGRGNSGDDLHQEGEESISDSPQQSNNSIYSPPVGEGKGEGEYEPSVKRRLDIRRMDLTDALSIMIFAALGIYLFRLIPFYVPVAVLFIARYRVGFAERFRTSRNDSNGESNASSAKPGTHASTSQIAISALLSLLFIFTLMKGTLFGGLITTNLFHRDSVIVGSKYPEKAVKFLKESGIRGNMFNPLDWGGYLMWYLYPDYKVFTDGRGLREDVVVQASKIMAAVKNDVRGMPEWKAHLEHYNVSMIVTYSVEHFSGRLLPLIPALLNDNEWNLIYVDELSLVFARETPENSTSISKFSMQKEWVWHEVISEAQMKSRGFFSDNVRVTFLITMGDAFLSLKDYKRAMDAYAKSWRRDTR